jgi:WD40 repeat protein
LSFDREGEALAAGSDDALVSIFDVRTGNRIRNLNCHSKAITAISWHRSKAAPYIIATGSADSTIVFHDVRAKVSVINQIRNQHEGQITKLEWSCNHSPIFMESTSQSESYLASASSLTPHAAQIGVWSLRDILHSPADQLIKPILWDAHSHSSPISALCWCPVKYGIFVTGGS